MKQSFPKPGLRCSIADVCVLVLVASLTPVLYSRIGAVGLLPAFVVGHFFLFCNVFRIRRKPELLWAVSFVALIVCLIGMDRMNPWTAMLLQLPVTILLISLELRRPDYHGIFSCRINPLLNEPRD